MIQLFGVPLPPAAIVGLIGEENSGIAEHLRGSIPGLTVVNYALDGRDPVARLRGRRELIDAQRSGATVVIASWHEDLLRELCDEIWWIEQARVIRQGDPNELLAAWREHIAARWRNEQSGLNPVIQPSLRRGDGRALVRGIELLDQHGNAVLAWRSGEQAAVRLLVEFLAGVENPVVGMLIRTRVGVDVYGTNTELERLNLGPRRAGDKLRIDFAFRCDLCPGDYTLTAASHDPDGTWHEWLEEAVAFSVCDNRSTAGVANLRAQVTWELY